jgi:hypothetical protein
MQSTHIIEAITMHIRQQRAADFERQQWARFRVKAIAALGR